VLDLLDGDYADVGMTRAEVEQALDVHKNTAQQVLKALKDDGLVVCTGKNQHNRFFQNRGQNRPGDF
jgi:predicted ArsR family transcriptional regulator